MSTPLTTWIATVRTCLPHDMAHQVDEWRARERALPFDERLAVRLTARAMLRAAVPTAPKPHCAHVCQLLRALPKAAEGNLPPGWTWPDDLSNVMIHRLLYLAELQCDFDDGVNRPMRG